MGMASGDVTRGKAYLQSWLTIVLLLAARTHAKTMLAYLDFLQIRIYELSGYSKLEGLEMAGLVLQKTLSFAAVTSVKTLLSPLH